MKVKNLLFKRYLIPFILSNFLLLGTLFVVIFSVFSMLYMSQNNKCDPADSPDISINGDSGADPASIDDFVKQHKDAYILSWKAGGFLPSASIAQTDLILRIHQERLYGKRIIWAASKHQVNQTFLLP